MGIGPDLAGKAAGGRRLIAVVYADMVGYSRLIGQDDAGTLRRLRTLRRALIDPAIREHGGRTVQTGGDSLLVAFDSIDGAVRCAVKVQQQVPVYDGDQQPDRRIRFRIGINIGDAIPHGTDLHGDAVNVAARLEAESPVGGICVSRPVRDHVHGRLGLTFEALGPLTLKNIARPVEAFVLRVDRAADGEQLAQSAAARRRARSRAALAAGLAGLLLVGMGAAGWWQYFGRVPSWSAQTPGKTVATAASAPSGIGLSQAPRLSVGVLPFKNLSGDPKDNSLAESITSDVTTDLARHTAMFVTAHEAAYTYQGKTIDLRKVGEELGVRYALEGSVRRLGETLHVNVQLIATETGEHVWADSFDQSLSDLSAGQTEIVYRVAWTLIQALVDLENARSQRDRPSNPSASDLILRAWSLQFHPKGWHEHQERIALLEQALRLDPRSVSAMAQLADEIGDERSQNYGVIPHYNERAAKLIADAAAIDPNYPYVLEANARHLFNGGHCTQAILAYQRLLSEYPDAGYAYNFIGACLMYMGRAAEAIPMFETALRRDPRSSNRATYGSLGFAALLLGRYGEAIVWSERALVATPSRYNFAPAQYNLHIAAAYARLGRLDDAHRAVAEANRIWPYDTVRGHSANPASRVFAGQIEKFQEALRIAGHRDHAAEDADFGVTSDTDLHWDYAGLTPTTAPGAKTVRTADLARLLDERKPLVIDPLLYSWRRSIPGAIGLWEAGRGGSTSDELQERLRKKMLALTHGDLTRPVVAVGWNSERFDGRNLALRLVALGYTNVFWYRGGREAWEVAELAETQIDVQDW